MILCEHIKAAGLEAICVATLKDIANLAGVSQGTVSNVLNGRGNVSSEKIKLVESAIAQLGYTINERAKLLRKGHSNIIALVLPDTRTRRYNDIYSSFKIYAERNGYSVSLYLTGDNPRQEMNIISKLRSDMVIGVATISCAAYDNDLYLESGFPKSNILYIERMPAYDGNYIGFSYQSAGECLANAALQQNKNLAIFVNSPVFSNDGDFLKAVRAITNNRPLGNISIIKISIEQRQKEIINFLSKGVRYTSFIVSDFSLAEEIITILRVFFPEMADIPVYTISPLFTLPESFFLKYEMDYRKLGDHAAKQLIEQIVSKKSKHQNTVLSNNGFREWHPKQLLSNTTPVLNLLMLNGPEADAVEKMARLYTKYTGVVVNTSVFSYDEIFEIINNTEGSAYDILRIDITFLSWFAQRVLVPLRQLDPDIKKLFPQFLEGIADRYSSIAGDVYALPFSPSVQLLYYRKDLFESTVLKRLYYEQFKKSLTPPTSFAEFNCIAKFFTKNLNPSSPIEYGASLTLGSIGVAGSEFMARFLETHKNLYDDDGIVRLNCREGINALQQLIDLKPCAPENGNIWWTDTADDFASGRVAMAIIYSNYASNLLKNGTLTREEIGCTLVPGNNPILGGAALGISKHSSNKKLALDFIKWICSETVSSAATLLGGISPCKAAYQNYELLEAFPWLQLAGKSFTLAKGRRQPPEMTTPFNERQFLQIIGVAVKNSYNGMQSPEDALEWAQKEFERVFSH